MCDDRDYVPFNEAVKSVRDEEVKMCENEEEYLKHIAEMKASQEMIYPDEVTGVLGQILSECDNIPENIAKDVQDLYSKAAKMFGKKSNADEKEDTTSIEEENPKEEIKLTTVIEPCSLCETCDKGLTCNASSVVRAKNRKVSECNNYSNRHDNFLIRCLNCLCAKCEKQQTCERCSSEKCNSIVLKCKGIKYIPFDKLDKDAGFADDNRARIIAASSCLSKRFDAQKYTIEELNDSTRTRLFKSIPSCYPNDFSQKQMERIDEIDNAVMRLIKTIVCDSNLSWDIGLIEDIENIVMKRLAEQHGFIIYSPIKIHNFDGQGHDRVVDFDPEFFVKD